jgi:hypothetical protein
MVPQLHEPAEEAEVDFAEFWAYLDGSFTKLWLFSLRFSASGRAFHRAYCTQAQEAFLAGHVHAFEGAGGIPGRIRYDNLKPAVARVLFGRDRVESERFVAFRSHYGFDSFYCRPGKEGAHEKGGVEGDVGWFRRNHLVPVPRVGSLRELNELIDAADEADLDRVIEGHRARVGVEFAREAPLLEPLPVEAFDTARELRPRVDAKARVCVRQCRYSVPVSLVGKRVSVRLGATDVVALVGSTVVARHERLVHRGDESLILDHYLEILTKKPGALPASVPLAQARAAGVFCEHHERYWKAARRELGDRDGTRALIEVLLLERVVPADAIAFAIERTLALGTVAPAVVCLEARRAGQARLAPVLALAAAPEHVGSGPDLARYDRAAPDLVRYERLLGAGRPPTIVPQGTNGESWGEGADQIAGAMP